MHDKDPRHNCWKYKSFNYTDIEHKEVKASLDYIRGKTQLKEKVIIQNLLRKEVERLENEKGNNSINSV